MSSSEPLLHSVLYNDSVALTAGTFVSGISWGIMTSFYSVCMYSLICNLRSANAKKNVLLATWITILWILSTLSTFGYAITMIYSYTWRMDLPGGPEAYVFTTWNEPLPILIVSTFILTVWFADAMVLWRLVVFHHGIHHLVRCCILSLTFLIYIGILGTGSSVLALISFNQTLYSTYAKKFSIPFLALSVTLDVFGTAFISTRLLLYKRTIEKALGRNEARASPYTSIAAMLIESAALYATWSVASMVVYVMNSPGQCVMSVTLFHVQVISPVMIIYRVSKGLGWESTPSAKLTMMSRMAFAECQGESHAILTRHSVTQEQQEEDKLSTVMLFASPTRSAVGIETV